MNNALRHIALILLALIAASCDSDKKQEARKRIKDEVQAAQRQLPMDMGVLGSMTGLDFDDNKDILNVTFSVNPDVFPQNSSDIDFSPLEENVRYMFLGGDSEQRGLLELLAQAEAGVSFRFNVNGKVHTVTLSPDDIKDINSAPPISRKEMADRLVLNNIKLENGRCPLQVDQITRLDSVTIDGQTIRYHYTLNDRYTSLPRDVMDDAVNLSKDDILSNMKYLDSFTQLFSLYAEGGYSLAYIYNFASGQPTKTITITASEIAETL